MPRGRRNQLIAIVPICAAVLLTVHANQLTRLLEGTVTDQDGQALEKAVVQVKDEQTLSVRSCITDSDGKYQMARLGQDVDYEVVAQYRGQWSDKRILSRFDSRNPVIVNLRIKLER